MRCFQPPADVRFYAGVDLHARSLFLCVLDRDGRERFARNLTAAPEPFLKAVQPFRESLVGGCECMHCWYWLADACRDAHIAFALGHAWAMKAVLASPLAEMSPPFFDWPQDRERMGIGTGRGAFPGPAVLLRGAGPPESACVLGAARPRP